MVNPRAGTSFNSPAQQTIITGINHSPHGSLHNFSAGASPSTNSPTGGSSSLVKITIAQVYVLLSTIRDERDRTKCDQLQKLIDANGMEVFQKYFSRLVVTNSPQIFTGHSRTITPSGNYQLLVAELQKVILDVDQARRIAESIETANEDVFRDFDLSTFMEHFGLDALEKTLLALAFKLGTRADLKTKADAILSANFNSFVQLLASNNQKHETLTPAFVAVLADRYIQEPPPNFNQTAKQDLGQAIQYRYDAQDISLPTEVLSALYLMEILNDHNQFALAIHANGASVTADEDRCRRFIRQLGFELDSENIASALIYTAISRTPSFSPVVLINSIRQEAKRNLNWPQIVAHFDQPDLRITSEQFLSLYTALKPLAVENLLDIETLWGGRWRNSETQLSFLAAFSSLSPDQLDATTIPGLHPSFTIHDLDGADEETMKQAAEAVRHPLVSLAAVSAMFHVALHAHMASDTIEAKRLFQQVVVPNLAIFVVSAFGVPKPWPELAIETINSLFDRFVYKYESQFDLVLEACWRKDKDWVAQRLVAAHANQPLELRHILQHTIQHGWLDELVFMLNGFGLDLAALAHADGYLDLANWAHTNSSRSQELKHSLVIFLGIKAEHELEYQRSSGRPDEKLQSVQLPVKTVAALLGIFDSIPPTQAAQSLISVQRACITAYPRLINYGEGFDDIIDANGINGNSLPDAANKKMEEHYKKMYSEEMQVKSVVEALEKYKRSRDPSDQDVFACMIHGLFDEYGLYSTYPLEALATTAVLFGGIISHKLISELPLEIGLGMILEAVRDHSPDQAMYKFGLQALMQLFSRLPEWPGFCRQLTQVPGLIGTDAYNKAQEVIRNNQEDHDHGMNGSGIANGNIDEILAAEPTSRPFTSLHVDPTPDEFSTPPSDETQDKVLFVLNNITGENLKTKFGELKDVIEERHQQWFAEHIVEERAKLQPNYHALYLDLVRLFGKKTLWSEVLRETYVSVIRMLNSESTMQSAVERTHLKNLGGWLGSLTLAQDKPIKYKNIAFKQLLLEAFDTQRLVIVIPFVCKVLVQGHLSTVFKPPNPWLMDIIHLLIELYHNAELKLNLKFEIEVLCKDLKLDHKTIEPSTEIASRVPVMEEATEVMIPDMMDRFDNISLNGLGGATNGRFEPQEIAQSVPDLGPLLVYPPANDMVDQSRLQEIVRTAITRAIQEIIAPVVERSVTIAAISTAQMIHKDFATEPSEARVRSAAINMVKKTAGALALVTSKEPLRASMTNLIRTMANSQSPGSGLPEGTIIMCVNSNLDLACSQVEKKAEERAVPEIESMIEEEMENRRQWQHSQSNEPYQDRDLSRWSWTIPHPYKLQPSASGLNAQQMEIYDAFARQHRQPSLGGAAHIHTTSDATQSLSNEILQPQYPSVPNLLEAADPPTMPHMSTIQAGHTRGNIPLNNGRNQSPNDPRQMQGQMQDHLGRILEALQTGVMNAPEQHYSELPRPSALFDVLDALFLLIFKSSQGQEQFDLFIIDSLLHLLFGTQNTLLIETLTHVLQNTLRIGGRTANRVTQQIGLQSGEQLLNVPLVAALVKAEMIEWRRVDAAASGAIEQRKNGSLEFLTSLLDTVLLNERPVALYTDLAKSLEVAWIWIEEVPSMEIGRTLKEKLINSGLPQSTGNTPDERLIHQREQMEYIFDEWVHLYDNPNATERAAPSFIFQLYKKQQINAMGDLWLFLQTAIDNSVDHFNLHVQGNNDMYTHVDALAILLVKLVMTREVEGEVQGNKAAFLTSILSSCVLILNSHHTANGEHFNQRVFFRLFSTMLIEFKTISAELSEVEHKEILIAFSNNFLELKPTIFPGFLFSWLALVSHRDFMPVILRLPDDAGWDSFAKLLETLFQYLGHLLKPVDLTSAAEMLYQAALKLVTALQHDFPEFLAAYDTQLLRSIPVHCTSLYNMILAANPAKFSKMPDPTQQGLKVDRLPEIRETPQTTIEVESTLQERGLFDLLEQALQNGPGEDVVAAMAHEIQIARSNETSFAFIPVKVDLKLIDAIVAYIGTNSIAKAAQSGGPHFVPESTAASLLSMLVRELRPEARYYLLNSIANRLRYANNQTHFFAQALLHIWGVDSDDPEETDIRQQITRVLLERLITTWSHPWGLVLVCTELIKNDTYNFFNTPFIKSMPEIGERFAALMRNNSL